MKRKCSLVFLKLFQVVRFIILTTNHSNQHEQKKDFEQKVRGVRNVRG
jgi:hypothetical protein